MDTEIVDKVAELLRELGGATSETFDMLAREYAMAHWVSAITVGVTGLVMVGVGIMGIAWGRRLYRKEDAHDDAYMPCFIVGGLVFLMGILTIAIGVPVQIEMALSPHVSLLRELL